MKYGVMGSFNNGSVMNITGASVIEATISNLMLSTKIDSIEIAAMNHAGTGVFSNAIIIKTVEQSEFVKLLRNHS